jgi:hypothetical protein
MNYEVHEMKRILSFDVDGIESLMNLLRKGFIGYSTNAEQHGGLTTLWLFLCDQTVLKIYSSMTDVGGWDEVGTLVFRLATKEDTYPKMKPLGIAWSHIFSIKKLVLDETRFSAESGLVIKNNRDEELTVICGANVYTIQIEAPFFTGNFQPEYEIDAYKRIQI